MWYDTRVMTEVESLSVEILKQIRTDLKDGLAALRQEVGKTNERLDKTNEQLNELKEMQNVLAGEHRKTNQRLDFFAEELVRMRPGTSSESTRSSAR